jgi:non-specific serine/threonine protein kinase/serine/threonine-protein kinase
MGCVYAAEQQQPRRIVALKVIRADVVSLSLLRRFEQESQVLGRLHHPGIAQVYEAGTADAGHGPQPFFAMELIAGAMLTEYASANRLTTRGRIALMAKVCDAVHHAHQRGIIHRDLKPGNILIDETGQPKVLDFGVAHVTDSDELATRQTDVGQLIGTLAYMSPEQVLADPLELDTRSDVYALGVILYELLSGHLPYNVKRRLVHEVVQTIREDEPTALSSVNRVYRGDIETIVTKALEKDKTRRYNSAASLGADLQRFLNDEPIVARPASAAYQLSKFARRHRTWVFAASAILVVLVAGIIASTWQAYRATEAERTARRAESEARAERDRASAAEVRANLDRDRAVAAERATANERDRAVLAEAQANTERDRAVFQQRRADTEAATARTVNEFLQRDLLAQASSDSQTLLNDQPDPDIKVRTVLDRAAARIGDRFDTNPQVRASIEATIGKTYEDLGIYESSQRHFENALKIKRATVGAEHPETLAIAQELGGLYRAQAKYTQAEALLEATLGSYRRVKNERGTAMLLTMQELATVYTYQAKFQLAEPLLREAFETSTRQFGPEDPNTASIMLGLAGLYFRQRKFAEAEPLLVAVLQVRRRTSGASHSSTLNTMNNLGVLYQNLGRHAEAEPILSEVLDVRRRLSGPDHVETLNAMNNLALVYATLGRDEQAEPLYTTALEASRRTLGDEHPRSVTLMNNLGLLFQARNKLQDAEVLFRTAYETRLRLLGPDHPDTITVRHNLADVYSSRGNLLDCEALTTQNLAIRRRLFGPDHAETASSLTALSALRIKQREYAQAESLARSAVAILERTHPNSFRAHRAEALLGASLAAQRKFAEGEFHLTAGHAGMQLTARGTMDRMKLKETGEQIVGLYESWNKTDEAGQWRSRLTKNN